MDLKSELFTNKKIGIWGFGVVGKSAAKYLVNKFAKKQELNPKQEHTHAILQLSVLDKRELTEQECEYLQENNITFVNQNDTQNFKNFLENNDLIIPSPGVDLRKYKQYAHKFISEFDLFQAELSVPIIGVTGTVGKTTVTHMLDHIIKAQGVNIWTGGNIGTPVLDVITGNFTEITQNPLDLVLLELSSFQLELCKTFAPDLAIWTNFFPNHLDKHSDMQEYFLAKLQILANQTPAQCALLPISLLDKLEPFFNAPTQIKSKLYFFSENKPAQELIDKLRPQDTLFYLDESNKHSVIKLSQESAPENIGSIAPLEELAEFTFRENLLIIFASLYIISENINRTLALSDSITPYGHPELDEERWPSTKTPFPLTLSSALGRVSKGPHACQIEHRLEKVATIADITFYNDSKATTAASTIAAVQKMASKNKPIILLLGGLSKGVDRSPMIKEIKKYEKHVKLVISFGKEAEIIKNMCDNEGLPCESFENMQQAVRASFSAASYGDQVLLSPSGSSFDLFKDYQDRGHKFKEMVLDLANTQKSQQITG